jgi:nickel-type superoxide dismutase maturation protease
MMRPNERLRFEPYSCGFPSFPARMWIVGRREVAFRPVARPPGAQTPARRSLGRLPWVRVLVSGPSMVPTLRHGDQVIVARSTRIRPGDVVVGAFPARPELLVVKRAVRATPEGWWLVSDNEAVTDDSRRYGAAQVYGRVLLRCWPPRRVAILGRSELAPPE